MNAVIIDTIASIKRRILNLAWQNGGDEAIEELLDMSGTRCPICKSEKVDCLTERHKCDDCGHVWIHS